MRPLFPVRRARERALLVAEELGLEDRLGQRRAVDGDERARQPRRLLVDRARDELFARARLTEQQHRRRRGRGLLHRLHRREHRRRSSDDRAPAHAAGRDLGELAAQHHVLGAQRLSLEGALGDAQHDRGLEGLLDEVVRALAHRLDGVLDRRVRGHHDDVDLRPNRARGAQQILTGHARHHQVGEDHVDRGLPHDVERELPRRRRLDRHAFALEQAPQRLQVFVLVVDDEELRRLEDGLLLVAHGGRGPRPEVQSVKTTRRAPGYSRRPSARAQRFSPRRRRNASAATSARAIHDDA
jgi:hypothetical protein